MYSIIKPPVRERRIHVIGRVTNRELNDGESFRKNRKTRKKKKNIIFKLY